MKAIATNWLTASALRVSDFLLRRVISSERGSDEHSPRSDVEPREIGWDCLSVYFQDGPSLGCFFKEEYSGHRLLPAPVPNGLSLSGLFKPRDKEGRHKAIQHHGSLCTKRRLAYQGEPCLRVCRP